jgi:hypothetical protein
MLRQPPTKVTLPLAQTKFELPPTKTPFPERSSFDNPPPIKLHAPEPVLRVPPPMNVRSDVVQLHISSCYCTPT